MQMPPAPEQKSLVGYTIGKCKLLRICGRGAMGTVYKGLHTGLDIEVAVKILPPHLALNANLVERFMREAKLAARLNHVNTVRVYDVGEESGYYYLVMEYIDGTDALELLHRHGPQPAWVVADIGAGAARALEHAHKNGVIHRDIKPANLMLPNGGGVKVADFGLARALASESGLTMTGAIMGTPDYMAPEQAQGASVGAVADAYSLGATLYHLFVGRPPFTGATPMAVALQHVTSRITVPENLLKDNTARQLARAIHDLTQKDAARRPDDLDLMARRLKDIARANKRTHKLLSEGATLFATVGVKIDVEAINKAKEEAAAAELDKGRIESPHLDKLRQAAKKARSGLHAALPESLVEKPRVTSTEMAEITGEMVREARSKAKRSSGRIEPVREVGDGTTVRRANSNPDLSPHRDPRPSSGSTRKQAVVQESEMDDVAWQSYAAQSFPTFERTSIIDGSAREEVARSGSGIRQPDSASSTTPDFSAPVAIRQYRSASRTGAGVGLLVALLVIAAAAVGGWYFFLRGGDGKGGKGGTELAGPSVRRIQVAEGAVTAIISRKDGGGFFAGSDRGDVSMWERGADKPAASNTLNLGAITALAVRVDGKRLAVGTDRGEVLELDVSDLKILTPRVHKVDGKVTALAYPLHSLLLIGSSRGVVQPLGGEPVTVEDGAPVSGLIWRGDELWVAAGRTVAQFTVVGDNLALHSSYPSLPAPVTMLAQVGHATYAAMGTRVQRITPQGMVGDAFVGSQPFVAAAPGGRQVVAVGPDGLVFLHPESLKQVAATPVARLGAPQSAAMYSGGARLLIGTSSGEIIEVVGR